MIKAIGQSLVHEIRDHFSEFTNDPYQRVFLWDDANGYPSEDGSMVTLNELVRPFCLVNVVDNESSAANLGVAVPIVEDRYDVQVLVYSREPEDVPYEHDTLPEQVKFHFATHEIEILDRDRQPAVSIATVGAEDLTLTRTGAVSRDAVVSYRSTIRMSFTLYRDA